MKTTTNAKYRNGIKRRIISTSKFEDLVTLTFDRLTCKWGHGSRVAWAKYQLATLFHSRLRVRHGTDKTDRQTDGHTAVIIA